MSPLAGFFGKIPTRGDFVRQGLPADFTGAMDQWWQRVLPYSQARLGKGWEDAWMQAPIWCFALPPGRCGAGAAVGLWLPSTDKVGRLFPLTIAWVSRHGWNDIARCGPFLAAAEAIGVRAVEQDVSPAELAEAVAASAVPGGEARAAPAAGGSLWWSDGGPLVAPSTRRMAAMPDGDGFTAMLCDLPHASPPQTGFQ
jgi:type VI secretion system protein ImpM